MNAMNNKQLVIEKPIIINDVSKVEVFDFVDDKYRVLIEDFYNTLKMNLSYDNLLSFYLNIKDIVIIDKSNLFNLLRSFITEGSYDFRNNVIRMYCNKYRYCDVFKHELLHMSTRRIDMDKCHVGFLQVYKDYYIGNALNVGYTDVICKELFSNYNPTTTSYNYQMILARIIERIIGKGEMKDLYFSSNLYELVNVLSKYNTLYSISTFLTQTDYITTPLYRRELVDVILDINSFMYETFTNYLMVSYSDILLIEREYKLFVDTMNQIINTVPYDEDVINRNLEYNTKTYKSRLRKLY